MAKITVLEQKTFEGKPSGFKVTLSDGTTGNLQEKESDKGLRVGDEVDVTLIPYTSKKGITSNLLGLRMAKGNSIAPTYAPPTAPSVAPPYTPPPKPQIHVGTGKSAQELKADASIKMAEVLLKALFDDKLDDGQVVLKHKEFSRLLWSDIDEIFSGK